MFAPGTQHLQQYVSSFSSTSPAKRTMFLCLSIAPRIGGGGVKRKADALTVNRLPPPPASFPVTGAPAHQHGTPWVGRKETMAAGVGGDRLARRSRNLRRTWWARARHFLFLVKDEGIGPHGPSCPGPGAAVDCSKLLEPPSQ
ncbi:hypothetical protein ZWY2020_054210 [Hordeum vulgare]|nr:hypothetical protein ZWY2020_054210 [Hordeum vulgare]